MRAYLPSYFFKNTAFSVFTVLLNIISLMFLYFKFLFHILLINLSKSVILIFHFRKVGLNLLMDEIETEIEKLSV